MNHVKTLVPIRQAREVFLSGGGVPDASVRPEIAGSWYRSADFRVPHDRTEVPQVSLDQLDDELLALVGPVLQRLADRLQDTGVGLLLSDANARILRRWSDDRRVRRFFDRVQTDRGSQLSEDAVGTNGVGTPVTLSRLVHVQGPEHVLDLYQHAVCTGAPIYDPITGRTAGAVTLSCEITPHSGLLVPLLMSTMAEVQQHLLDRTSPGERQLLAAFLRTTRSTRGLVVGLLGSSHVATSEANRVLTPVDMGLLERTAQLIGAARGPVCVPLTFSGGRTADVLCTPVGDGEPAGWIMQLDVRQPAANGVPTRPAPGATSARPARAANIVGDSPPWRRAIRAADHRGGARIPILVTGDPGSGRTVLARRCATAAGVLEPTVIDGSLEQVDGTASWLLAFREATGPPGGATIVRHLDSLSPGAALAVAAIIDELDTTVTAVIATAVRDRPDGPATAMLFERFAVATIAAPPLRSRPEDIPALVRALSARHGTGRILSFTPEAMEALQRFDWPGNVRQLENVVRRLLADGLTGLVPRDALPADIADASRRRRLTLMEEVELNAIKAALALAEGNRAQAAKSLGISRATLYRRLRAHGLVDRALTGPGEALPAAHVS